MQQCSPVVFSFLSFGSQKENRRKRIKNRAKKWKASKAAKHKRERPRAKIVRLPGHEAINRSHAGPHMSRQPDLDTGACFKPRPPPKPLVHSYCAAPAARASRWPWRSPRQWSTTSRRRLPASTSPATVRAAPSFSFPFFFLLFCSKSLQRMKICRGEAPTRRRARAGAPGGRPWRAPALHTHTARVPVRRPRAPGSAAVSPCAWG